VTLTVNKTTVGTYLRDQATIAGAPQSVTLSYTTTSDFTVTFNHNPITDSLTGVRDLVTLHESFTIAPGKYYVTITATGADGAKSSVMIMVNVHLPKKK